MGGCEAECLLDVGLVVGQCHSTGVIHGIGAVRKDKHCIFHWFYSMLYAIL